MRNSTYDRIVSAPAIIDDQAIHGTWLVQVGCSVSGLTRCL